MFDDMPDGDIALQIVERNVLARACYALKIIDKEKYESLIGLLSCVEDLLVCRNGKVKAGDKSTINSRLMAHRDKIEEAFDAIDMDLRKNSGYK